MVPPVLLAMAIYLLVINDSMIEWMVILAVGVILALYLMHPFKWAGVLDGAGTVANFTGVWSAF